METGEAISILRADPANVELIRDSYLDEDVALAGARFERSAEFAAACALLPDVRDLTLVDVGAGRGIASTAFAARGAQVVAIDPDTAGSVGLTGIEDDRVARLCAVGEALPLRSECADVLYCRQVLHHTSDLEQVLREMARVLVPGGQGLLCREHVVDNDKQLAQFLRNHPVHQLAGGESAYAEAVYAEAIRRSGLRIDQLLGPWDSVINAFPTVRSQGELRRVTRTVALRQLGAVGGVLAGIPVTEWLLRKWITRAKPGRFVSFVVSKP